jgi:F-type H+-transporting ATPase subunit delta
MNAGIISTRYARAIYEYAAEKDREIPLYNELKVLSGSFSNYPVLRKVMSDPVVAPEDKVKTLMIASGKHVSDILEQVFKVVVKNGRAHYIESIALMYDQIYRKAKGIVTAHLITVEPAGKTTETAMMDVVSTITGYKSVEFQSETDPDLIGGFVLEIGDNRLDASVKGQLNQIKCQI